MEQRRQTKIRRFTPVQRFFHLLLLFTFLVQGATGLARMTIETSWGQGLAWFFGGYVMARAIHVYVGIAMLIGFAVHFIYLLFRIDWKNLLDSLKGPDSILPSPADARQFLAHVRWFFGGGYPEIDRWGYWEKFDYWAVFWGMVIMGITGLLLAYPLAASKIIPGWGLNVAFWIHRIEALLAMTHVFVIHFFIAHLRRHSFPMDRAMFEGSVDLETARHEKPAWVARLTQTGNLENALVPEASGKKRLIQYGLGYLAIGCGLFLLIGGIINLPRITW